MSKIGIYLLDLYNVLSEQIQHYRFHDTVPAN